MIVYPLVSRYPWILGYMDKWIVGYIHVSKCLWIHGQLDISNDLISRYLDTWISQLFGQLDNWIFNFFSSQKCLTNRHKTPKSLILFHKKRPPQDSIERTLAQAFKAKCMQNQIFSSSISFLDMELSLFEKCFKYNNGAKPKLNYQT